MRDSIRILSVMCFLIIATHLNAQYQSVFGLNHTSWKTSNCGALSAPCFVDSASTIGFDTIFGGEYYKLVRSFPTSNEFYLSEDTTTGVVWYKGVFAPDTVKIKLMDLNLLVNDTFDFGPQGGKQRVDSVYFENNRKVIRFDYTFSVYSIGGNQVFTKLKMIEGVGTNMGVNYVGFNGLGVYLLCQEKDTIKVFNTNSHPTLNCNSNSTVVVEHSLVGQLDIYPNPASNYITFELNSLKSSRVEILTNNGRVLKVIENPKNKLEVGNLNNGIYFLKVYTELGPVVKKFLISQ